MERRRESNGHGSGLAAPMLLLALTMGSSQAGEFARLKQDPDLSPQRLLSHFAHFGYELGEQLQDPETFLQRGRGDCDDFASLADRLLTERGWNPGQRRRPVPLETGVRDFGAADPPKP